MTKSVDWEDRDEFEREDSIESEEDIAVSSEDFAKLVIAPSDWTVSTIYDLIGRQLQLDPAYQRRNVWQYKAKSQFIESLFLGVPIPQILLATKAGQKNSFLVLDGKQRLTAIKEFLDGKFFDGKPFRLRGLRILKYLEGRKWSDLEHDEEWGDRLLNEPVRTTVLRGWQDEAVLYEIFYRLNSGSVRLSPMELRMSLYPGEFLKFIIAWTENIGSLHHLLRKKQPDARMADVELAIRFLAFQDGTIEYNGDLKQFLDSFCKLYNSRFDNSSGYRASVERLLRIMEEAIKTGIEIFGENRFCRKYLDGRYETRFNRAVFDVLVGSLCNEEVLDWGKERPEQFRELYEHVCNSEPEFTRSVETTTKSVEATRSRFSIWYRHVEVASNAHLKMPLIK